MICISTEVQSLDELEMAVSVPGQSDSASDVQEDAENDSQSSSGIEELAMPEEGEVDEEEIEGMGQIGESSQEAHQLTLRRSVSGCSQWLIYAGCNL